ncbi:hypothetical protein I4I73_28580 [Pseudonocardia sp. KRD-184]|uniref:Uncharacterized protein n=1 Tax=Pseudonocardia oceani TaxID=2792013 RepID=A0ABS6U4M6_9PSEU|nr:DUF6319 family protein [Pseudonocardia oceani]MBW0093787.1 hypothetical protein [Pseudonocardia oceani]MBW0099945.1 hypothetical protein [Pseudonocardia oceani]MBW0125819.1 hypothetical protein [Pseudonocardia oceani]MBW0126926.1 hypothetical protein [Pseudonocardia oceani]
MTVPHALTEPDVVELRRETTAGGPVTVWFTEAAVGVPVGGSAKVVAVGEAGEGEFIQVRRSGSRDTMFCSPNELTRVRPSRAAAASGKRAESAGRGEKASAAASSGSRSTAARRAASAAAAPAAVAPAPAAVAPAPAAVAPAPAAVAPAPAAAEAPAAPARPARARRDTARSSELSVTLSATAEGEWSVEVLAGKKRVVPSTAVPATAVAAAARALPAAVAEAVESSVEGARRRQRERVEQLRAELDAAQRVLDEFEA